MDRTHASDGLLGFNAEDCLPLARAGSGKTRALEVSELLIPNAVAAVNVSPAYLFRKVADEAWRANTAVR